MWNNQKQQKIVKMFYQKLNWVYLNNRQVIGKNFSRIYHYDTIFIPVDMEWGLCY